VYMRNGRFGRVLMAACVSAGLMTASSTAQQPAEQMSQEEAIKRLQRALPRPPSTRSKPQNAQQPGGGPPTSNNSRNNGRNNARAKNGSVESTIDGDTFNFREAELQEVIEAVGALTGKNFHIDDRVKGRVTLITNSPIPPELAYEVLESILQAQGYAMVPSVDGNIIRVVESKKALSSNIPTGVGSERTVIEGYERFQTQLVPVVYGDAGEISKVVSNLMSQEEGRVDVYTPTNTMIITTTVTNLRRLLEIVRKIDVPGFEQKIWIRVLEYAQASDLAQEIEQVFGEDRAAAGRTPSTTVRQIRSTATSVRSMARPADSAIIGAEPTLRIVPDERTNSLIVVATQPMIDQVSDLIDMLDADTAWEEQNLHVYPLLNADAKEVADMLNQLTSGVQPRRGTQARTQQQAQIQPFEREVNIVAYEITNSLLIMASPEDYAVLEGIITKLDTQQRQVYVEAVIMEVQLMDGFQVEVDLAAFQESDHFLASTFANFADIANVLTVGPLAFAGGGALAGLIDEDRPIRIVSGYDPDSGDPIYQEIPAIPVLFTAIQTVSDLDVLSAPQLLTTDNIESKIVVGQEIPFITGSSRSLDQSAIQSTLYSQIKREDVGVQLTVTPQISEGEYVKLEVTVEKSSVIESAGTGDVNLVGPSLSKSEITNTAVIRDGCTGIIAGLMETSIGSSRSKVPILGDIPLLGFLFRSSSNSTTKRNLVILITPHIVKSREDLVELTEKGEASYEEAKNASRDIPNYLRRIFKKVKMPQG